MARLYADENVPLPVVERLRALGHDVLTIFEDGKGNQRYPDALVLRDAAESSRTLVTQRFPSASFPEERRVCEL